MELGIIQYNGMSGGAADETGQVCKGLIREGFRSTFYFKRDIKDRSSWGGDGHRLTRGVRDCEAVPRRHPRPQ